MRSFHTKCLRLFWCIRMLELVHASYNTCFLCARKRTNLCGTALENRAFEMHAEIRAYVCIKTLKDIVEDQVNCGKPSVG